MKNTMLHKKPERSSAPRDRKDNLCQTFDKYRLSPDLVDLGWRNELVQICLLSFRSQGITSKNFLALGEDQKDKRISNKFLKAFKSLEESQANAIMESSKESDLLAIAKQSHRKIGLIVQRQDGSFPQVFSSTCSEIWRAQPPVLDVFIPKENTTYRYT